MANFTVKSWSILTVWDVSVDPAHCATVVELCRRSDCWWVSGMLVTERLDWWMVRWLESGKVDWRVGVVVSWCALLSESRRTCYLTGA